MKKIIFLVFCFFSEDSFSIPCSELQVFEPNAPLFVLNPDSYDFVNFFPSYSESNSTAECSYFSLLVKDLIYIEFPMQWHLIFSDKSYLSCPTGSTFVDLNHPVYGDDYVIHHNGCMQQAISNGSNPEDCDFYLGGSVHHSATYKLYCPPTLLHVSEKTVIKTNDLLSESNSKLGSIAGSNSAITELLKQIKDALLSLNSANFGIFGTNADSSDLSNKYDPNSPEFEPELSNSEIDLTDIPPLFVGNSKTCPTDISIELMGSTHYFSYQSICDFAEKLNPIVIAAARVSAAWLILGAL